MNYSITLKKKEVCLYLGIMIILFACSIFFHYHYINGNDSIFHYSRILNIADSIKHGAFPTSIYGNALNRYGYASPIFYPDYLLYLPGYLYAIGVSLEMSMKIHVVLIETISIIIAYISFRGIFKNNYISLLCSILFLTANTTFFTLISRIALGDWMARLFVPVFLWGIFNLLIEKFSKPWILAIAFIGFMMTHTLSLFMSGIIFLVILFTQISYLIKNVRILLRLVLTGICTLGITIFYWLPMVEQFLSDSFRIISGNTSAITAGAHTPIEFFENPVLSILFLLLMYFLIKKCDRIHRHHAILFSLLAATGFMIDTIYDLIQLSALKEPNIISFTINTVCGCMFFIGLYGCYYQIYCQYQAIQKYHALFIAGSIIMFAVTDLFPWYLFVPTPVNAIQFPFRFNMFYPVFLAPWCILVMKNMYFHYFTKRTSRLFLACITIICIACVIPTYIQYNYTNTSENTFTLGDPANIEGAEWLPDGSTDYSLLNTETILLSDGSIPCTKEYLSLHFTVDEIHKTAPFYDIPYIYYKGYQAKLTDASGQIHSLPVTSSELNNHVLVSNPEQLTGEIHVWYEKTFLQKYSIWISLFFIGLSIFLCILFTRKERLTT